MGLRRRCPPVCAFFFNFHSYLVFCFVFVFSLFVWYSYAITFCKSIDTDAYMRTELPAWLRSASEEGEDEDGGDGDGGSEF